LCAGLLTFEICCLTFFPACNGTRPVLKIGLVAPFEGRYRAIGYDAIYAARLAVRERNASGGAGGYRVALVAYDDGGAGCDAPIAAERARQLALDPAVVAVIGHFRVETTLAAQAVYAREALPLIAPVIASDALPGAPCAQCSYPAVFRTGPTARSLGTAAALEDVLAGSVVSGTVATGAPWPRDVPEARSFIANYRAVAGGAEPGPDAWATYQAGRMGWEARAQAGQPARRAIGAQLAARFGAQGSWPNVPVYVYHLEPGQPPRLAR